MCKRGPQMCRFPKPPKSPPHPHPPKTPQNSAVLIIRQIGPICKTPTSEGGLKCTTLHTAHPQNGPFWSPPIPPLPPPPCPPRPFPTPRLHGCLLTTLGPRSSLPHVKKW